MNKNKSRQANTFAGTLECFIQNEVTLHKLKEQRSELIDARKILMRTIAKELRSINKKISVTTKKK